MTYSTVGTIHKPSGKTLKDDEGFEYQEMIEIGGYHVNALNLSADERETLEPYIVEVATPSVVFSGRNDTVCLKFDDREQWIAMGYEKDEVIDG